TRSRAATSLLELSSRLAKPIARSRSLRRRRRRQNLQRFHQIPCSRPLAHRRTSGLRLRRRSRRSPPPVRRRSRRSLRQCHPAHPATPPAPPAAPPAPPPKPPNPPPEPPDPSADAAKATTDAAADPSTDAAGDPALFGRKAVNEPVHAEWPVTDRAVVQGGNV